MALKLWHKLALTFLGITAIVLILAVILSRQSIKAGFLEYLNDIELQRLDSLSSQISDDYASSGNWEFIRGNQSLWHRYLRFDSPGKQEDLQQGRPLPRLNELGKRQGDPAQGLNKNLPTQRREPPPPPFDLGRPEMMPPPGNDAAFRDAASSRDEVSTRDDATRKYTSPPSILGLDG